MPLSWNEIKERAAKFSKNGKIGSERQEAKSGGNAFFFVFGLIAEGGNIGA
jgi:hypothetical protein